MAVFQRTKLTDPEAFSLDAALDEELEVPRATGRTTRLAECTAFSMSRGVTACRGGPDEENEAP